MNSLKTILFIFCLVKDTVICKPSSLQIKYIYSSQRIQIELNQTIKFPILISKIPRLSYEENVAFFLQNDHELDSHTTKLDYGNNNLAHFPKKLLSLVLPNLSELNFSKNTVTKLNSVEDFSKMLCQQKIETLDLSFNNLSTIDDENFRYLSNLKLLNLSYNQISQINLFAFSVDSDQITKLDLSHNLIKDSSLEFLLFSSLINLKWLNMDYNLLTSLSNHFLFNLYNLEYLSIKNNYLKSLDLFYFVNKNNEFLRYIDLSNNFGLKFQVYEKSSEDKVPESNIEELNLSSIDLSHLNLNVFLDNLFDKYKKLRVLNLSSAGIKSIIWSTKWPQSLKILDLSKNFLRNSQFDCTQFYLSNKNFNFSKIDLSNNQFENFSNLIDSCSTIFSQANVDLRFNNFDNLNKIESSNCTSSSHLLVALNPLVCDCNNLWWEKFYSTGNFLYKNICFNLSDYAELKCDSVSKQSMSQMSSFSLKPNSINLLWKVSTFYPIDSRSIRSLLFCPYKSNCLNTKCQCCGLDSCDCESVCPKKCRCVRDFLGKFDLVECTNSNLTIVPNVIPASSTELRLNQNGLRRIYPFQFFARSNLVSIDLSMNKIGFIEENGLNGIKNLKVLKLSNNLIQILLGYEFKDLINLEELHLDFNKIQFISNQTFHNLRKLKVLTLLHNNLRHLLEVNVFFRFNLNLFNLTIDQSKLIQQESKLANNFRRYDDIYFYNLIEYNLENLHGNLIDMDPLIKCILHTFKKENFLKEKNFIQILLDNLVQYKSYCDKISSKSLKVSTDEDKSVKSSNLSHHLFGYISLGFLAFGFSFLLVMLLNKYRKKSDVYCFKHLNKILKSKFMPFHRKRYEITDLNLVNKRPYYDLFLVYNKLDSCLVTKLISPIFRSKPYNFKLILQHDKIRLDDENLAKYVINSAFVLFVLSKNLFSDFEYDLAHKLPRNKKLAVLADDVPETLAEKLIQPGRILRGTFNLENMSFNFKSINIYEDSLDSGFDNDRVMDFDSFDESFVYKQSINFSDDFENIQIQRHERKIEF